MSLIVEETKGIEMIPEGVHFAVCKAVIDLGKQYSETFNKSQNKVMIIWEIPELTGTDKDGNEFARSISKEYTASLSERGNLVKDLNAWRGKAFTSDELKGFDLRNIVGLGCQIQIIHVIKNDKPRQNISGIIALPKGMSVEAKETPYFFDIDNKETWENYLKIPEWVCTKIEASEGFNGSELQKYILSIKPKEASGGFTAGEATGFMEVPNDSDLPF